MTGTFILFAGWLIDGTGGPILKNVLLDVKDGRIASIKDGQDYDSSRSDIVDLSHVTILPGLIDSHVHVFMSGTDDPEVRQYQLDAPFIQMKEVISRHLRQQLAHGIVAVRDGGDYAGHALRFKTECFPSGGLPIQLKSAGKAWRASRRYGKLIGRPPVKGISLASSIAQKKENSDHIKIVNSGLNSLISFGKETPPQFSSNELRAAVKAARDLGLKTMVHANGKLPVELAIEAGCHSIEHGFFMGKDNLQRMAENQITWVPTAVTMKAYYESLDPDSQEKEMAQRNLDHQISQISQAMEYGVTIAVGTDSGSLGVHHGSSFHEELGILMMAGMRLEKAVQCATLIGANVLELEDHFGRLEKGMPATFLVINTDPSLLPGAMQTVDKIFIQGKEWKAESA